MLFHELGDKSSATEDLKKVWFLIKNYNSPKKM
jgi:hypothetical protein